MRIAAGVMSTSGPHAFERRPGFPYWTLAGFGHGGHRLLEPGGEELRFDRYDFTLSGPDTPYLTRSPQPFRDHVYVFFLPAAEHLHLLDWPRRGPGVRCIRARDDEDHRRLHAALMLVHHSFQLPHPDQEALAFNALHRFLLLAQPSAAQAAGPQVRDPRILDALTAIEAARCDGAPSVAQLARRAGLSPSHFAHRFAREVGMPPARYVEQRRMRRAKELLLGTALPIQEVAAQVGYDNPFHFSARFTRCVGKSPRAYRAAPL